MTCRRSAPRRIIAATVIAAAAAVLAGCAGGAAADDGRLEVVASTNVYGQIASVVGGDDVTVSSIISKPNQDPHSFEPSARDQLTVSRADLIIDNGGGYDPYMDQLIQATGTSAPVITGVTFGPGWPSDAEPQSPPVGFNEHVWYDLPTMARVAEAIASELSAADPAHQDRYRANAAAFGSGIDQLGTSLAAIASDFPRSTVFVTEPVPLYLTAAAGLENVTPDAFTAAVEQGQDVPPATLLDALRLLKASAVDVIIANAQTGGAETTEVISTADARGIPVLEFTETLPRDRTYLEWMSQNIADLRAALA